MASKRQIPRSSDALKNRNAMLPGLNPLPAADARIARQLASLGTNRYQLIRELALEPMTNRELAELVNVEPEAVRGRLSRLKRAGLVEVLPGRPARYGIPSGVFKKLFELLRQVSKAAEATARRFQTHNNI
jgi:DNA-binding transcriptional ArsR family regulator